MIYISSSVNDLQGFRFQFCFWILHTCMINTYESMWERIQRNQFIIQFLYQWKKFTKDKLRFIIYVKTTSKKYLLYRMSDALANKLRIRSQLCREFLAEFLGTFILIVSWSLIYDYDTLTKELFYLYIFVFWQIIYVYVRPLLQRNCFIRIFLYFDKCIFDECRYLVMVQWPSSC